jgi:NTE family protein
MTATDSANITQSTKRPRVAIACQGGGSHTAFTAGVLKQLLESGALDRYELVGLSGTSGGAVCALLTWWGLQSETAAGAALLVEEFWKANSARTLPEKVVNHSLLFMSELQSIGLLPSSTLHHSWWAELGAGQLRQLLCRYVDFDKIDIDVDRRYPMLIVDAISVQSGKSKEFSSYHERITPETILASTAVPPLFHGSHIGHDSFWDGLFAQNPPVHGLLGLEPDELWVIRVLRRQQEMEPSQSDEVHDRGTDLVGSLTLYQSLAFVEKINQLLDCGLLRPESDYRPVIVRTIELTQVKDQGGVGAISRLNRDDRFIGDLMAHGVERTREFLAALAFERAWLAGDLDALMDLVADDAEISSQPPLPEPGRFRAKQVRPMLQRSLATGVRMDLTHRQTTKNRASWRMRYPSDGAEGLDGQATATFTEGKLTRLDLGPAIPSWYPENERRKVLGPGDRPPVGSGR